MTLSDRTNDSNEVRHRQRPRNRLDRIGEPRDIKENAAKDKHRRDPEGEEVREKLIAPRVGRSEQPAGCKAERTQKDDRHGAQGAG